MTSLLALALALAAPAAADPLALRMAPAGSAGPVLAAGWPDSSAGAWLGRRVGLALSVHNPLASAGLHAGLRHRVGASETVHLDLFGAAGLSVPLRSPGLAAAFTPAVRLERTWGGVTPGLGLSAPLAFGLVGGGGLRLPVLIEPGVRVAIGEAVWAAVQLGAGPVFVPGYWPATGVQLSVAAGRL